MSEFGPFNGEAFQSTFQHSFFKNTNYEETHKEYKPVYNFDVEDEKVNFNNNQFSIFKNYNDLNQREDENRLLSTKSTIKAEVNPIQTVGTFSYIQNSANEYLCSGYFGTKTENFSNNGNLFGNNSSSSNMKTKPFPMVEEERTTRGNCQNSYYKSAFEVLDTKVGNTKQKTQNENFNGSFLSVFSNNKTPKAGSNMVNSNNSFFNNLNTSTYSSNSTSFNDLVKSVSLSNFNKKKKSKI